MVSLNVARRMHRAVELVVGVSVSVGVGDLLIAVIGSGAWQIALVVALAMTTAVWLDSGPLIATQAGSSAVLVATLLPPGGTGGLERCLDALAGGAIGILVVALLPADPITPVRKAVIAVLDELTTTLRAVETVISDIDLDSAEATLTRVRGAQPLVHRLRETVRASTEIARFAPLRWSRRQSLHTYSALADHVDNALRNTRILARRALVAVRDRESTAAELPGALIRLADAVDVLGGELTAGHDLAEGRPALLDAALAVGTVQPDDQGFSSHVILAQLRSAVVELLQATGLPLDEAKNVLPATAANRAHAAAGTPPGWRSRRPFVDAAAGREGRFRERCGRRPRHGSRRRCPRCVAPSPRVRRPDHRRATPPGCPHDRRVARRAPSSAVGAPRWC